jgi:hypothetical protein
MPPNPLRIAQTTSEVKKQHKQNGPRIPERQLKQLERGHELDVRAARLREAEDRRKAAKKKKEERELKERNARKQMGVGLATQLIGYSHTQRQLKSGMEAFLGVKRRKEEEQRRRDAELTKKLEQVIQTVEKEPWDDDDDDVIDADGTALDLPPLESPPEQYVDDDLDDDTLLEAHDMLISDPVADPTIDAHVRSTSHLPRPPPSPTVPAISSKLAPPALALPPAAPTKNYLVTPPPPASAKDDADFTRLHGPINKAIETVLDKQPGPLLELMSQDISLKLPEWDPAPGLLHKLNPVGLPPHRLRVKVGSVVTLLRDLNTSSQLSKSQHLRILRTENERLECLVLDGQLEGTTAVLTRVPFPARYRNDPAYPFQRTQFPVRIAIDYTTSRLPRDVPNTGFKLPSVPGHVRASSLPKKLPSVQTGKPHANKNPTFKLPGLPASIKAAPKIIPPAVPISYVLDGWDDFLDSGTQIARELSPGPSLVVPVSPWVAESLPPLSTQDLDFSIDDLDDAPVSASATSLAAKPLRALTRTTSLPASAKPPTYLHPYTPSHRTSTHPTPLPRETSAEKRPVAPLKPKSRLRQNTPAKALCNLTDLTPSQKPPSVSDRPGLKRKPFANSTSTRLPPTKRPCAQPTRLPAPQKPLGGLSDFGMSTQEAASFFVDDDDMFSGSPPIAV